MFVKSSVVLQEEVNSSPEFPDVVYLEPVEVAKLSNPVWSPDITLYLRTTEISILC